MRKLIYILIAIFLTACGSKPTPIWVNETDSYLEKFKLAKLTGAEYKTLKNYAIESAKKGGDIYYLQIIELTDIALDLILENDLETSSYKRLETIEKYSENSSFFLFITNANFDIASLPKQYSTFAKTKDLKSAKDIKDPISKLIALSLIPTKTDEIYMEILAISKPNGFKQVTINALKKLRDINPKEKDRLDLMINELL